jgi:signal peptidase I
MSLVRKAPGFQTVWPSTAAGPAPQRPGAFGFFRELPVLIVLALGLAIIMKTFLLQAFYIPSGSMEPTLHGCPGCNGDRVIVNKLAYRFREPRRGEIIVFIAEQNRVPKSLVGKIRSFLFEGIGVTAPAGQVDYIKRVIGLPGETIEVTPDALFITTVDGKRFTPKEPYTQLDGPQNLSLQSPIKVPEGHLFVMGDNRNHSSDSRVIGPIKRTDVIGKAFVRIWPVTRLGTFPVPTYDDGLRALASVPTGAFVVVLPTGVAWLRRRRRARRAIAA